MNAIDRVFSQLRASGKRAFLPFLTAGDPDITTTIRLGQGLADVGASVIEIGFPYSDPIADGPVIQASYTRALDAGLRLEDVFRAARAIADARPQTPLAAMVSFSLVYRRGAERFLDQAISAGFSGAIVPDLPAEESENLHRLAVQRDFKLIQLVTPTTQPERAKQIIALCSGFLYCVSVAGITGERSALPPELLEQLAWLRSQTTLPLCVGFGISKPEHVRHLHDHADGVIVGSALVRQLEGSGPLEDRINRLLELAGDLANAVR